MKRSALVLSLALLSCAPAAPRPRTIPQPAVRAPQAVAQAARVVLISFDGLSADGLAQQMPVPGFDALQSAGAFARVIPVNPTATTSTHASILTGAQPQRHGIVANRFHLPGTAPDVTTHGFGAQLDAETIVEAARRQGKRVGAIAFPHVDFTSGPRSADFGMPWTSSVTQGEVIKLTRADFHREWVPPTWTPPPSPRRSFSPVMRARVEWVVPKKARADADVVAYDTTDDRVENYDSYFVELEGKELGPDATGWFPVAMPSAEGVYGSWSKLLETKPSLEVQLYRGPISRTAAYPEDYRQMLDAEAGFWPGQPDEMSDIDPLTFVQQMERLTSFLTRVLTLTISRMQFDLLLGYQPVIDSAAHNFLGYDDGVLRTAFRAAGHSVEQVRGALDLSRDALVVVGDHGWAPITREIRMNRLLADLGFAPRWRAFANGNVANLYRSGDPDDTAVVASALNASGYFEKIEPRQPSWHPNSGDLVVWGPPGTVLSQSSQAPVVAEPDSYGQHGALNTHREMHTMFFAAGAGVKPGPVGEIQQTVIARFVSGLLGIQPPAAAE